MKTKYPFLFILCLLCSAIIACSDCNEDLFESVVKNNENLYVKSVKTGSDITSLNLNDSILNKYLDSIIAENRYNDSIMIEMMDNDSIKARTTIIAQTPINNHKFNGYYICSVGYKGVSIHYETSQSNLFPPGLSDYVDITLEMSSYLYDIDLINTSYREVKRTNGYCMVRAIVQYRQSNIFVSEIRVINLGLLFEGKEEALVYEHTDKIVA